MDCPGPSRLARDRRRQRRRVSTQCRLSSLALGAAKSRLTKGRRIPPDLKTKKIDMKTTLLSLAGILLFSAGCATNAKTVLREPGGPSSPAQAAKTTNGHLAVYSCWSSTLHVDYDAVARAPYEGYFSDGRLLQHVFNDVSCFDRYPVTLSLPAGEYTVSSFVPGLGQATVPVQMKPGQTTTLHLEGSANRLKKRARWKTWFGCRRMMSPAGGSTRMLRRNRYW